MSYLYEVQTETKTSQNMYIMQTNDKKKNQLSMGQKVI